MPVAVLGLDSLLALSESYGSYSNIRQIPHFQEAPLTVLKWQTCRGMGLWHVGLIMPVRSDYHAQDPATCLQTTL